MTSSPRRAAPALLRIGDVPVGSGGRTYVIAEIGSNHDGSKQRAVELIEACADAGADAVKFQSFRADTLASREAERLHQFFSANELPADWLTPLATVASQCGVHFLSTPFDAEAVGQLAAVGVPAIKIASGDLTNHLLLREAAATGLPIIVSSGAAYLGDIERSLDVLERARANGVAVLHCVSAYPPAFSDMNLRAMVTIADAFGVPVGLSDHTPGAALPTAAVALGACLIEKHVTFDRSLPGPDHPYALTVEEFGAMVAQVRAVEEALGDGRKAPTKADYDERHWAWRGLYAAHDLPAGTVLTADHLVPLRPREGVGADEVDLVLGATVRTAIGAGKALTWEQLTLH